MSAKERLLTRVGSIIEKTAAAILWKYVDPEGGVFYMEERRMSTTRSPFSGQSFTAKPVRQSLTDVAKELRSGDAKVKGALWKYVGPSGESFYCDKRLVGTVKSPTTGKTFPAKPEKFTLSEVGKALKLEKSGPGEDAESDVDSKFLTEMKSMLEAKGYDPAFATTLQEEGMGPTELEDRLKDKKQFETNYNVPKKKSEAKTAEVKVAALSTAEKKVVDAFYEKKPAEGGMLTTDGKKLEKTGMGGSNFAEWKGGKIVIHPDRPTVKNDEEILRYMKKSIPANTLDPHPFLKSAQDQLVIASEILKMGSEHPAIKVITAQYEKVLAALVGEDPTIVMSKVQPEIRELSETCAVVAKQLEERVGRS
jgi:hypothetical protein